MSSCSPFKFQTSTISLPTWNCEFLMKKGRNREILKEEAVADPGILLRGAETH